MNKKFNKNIIIFFFIFLVIARKINEIYHNEISIG